MTEQLPVIININSELLERFSKIKSVCNKLEAQFNFQTLTANWYGDEDNVLTIYLVLDTPDSFITHSDKLHKMACENLAIRVFSDDVICSINDQELQLYCYIALTKSELKLLELQPKLLSGFIQIKLHKVLNLIADDRSLMPI